MLVVSHLESGCALVPRRSKQNTSRFRSNLDQRKCSNKTEILTLRHSLAFRVSGARRARKKKASTPSPAPFAFEVWVPENRTVTPSWGASFPRAEGKKKKRAEPGVGLAERSDRYTPGSARSGAIHGGSEVRRHLGLGLRTARRDWEGARARADGEARGEDDENARKDRGPTR